MTGLDCNILIQLAFADNAANARTAAAVQAEVKQGHKLVFPSLVVDEFLHVATDPRRFAPPFTMTEAVDWIENFLKNLAIELMEANKTSMDQTLQWMRQFGLGRKRILDTHLAAVLYANGVTRLLTANPADFQVFGVLEIVTP
jgi:predicted nucleic acid-binding protein